MISEDFFFFKKILLALLNQAVTVRIADEDIHLILGGLLGDFSNIAHVLESYRHGVNTAFK